MSLAQSDQHHESIQEIQKDDEQNIEQKNSSIILNDKKEKPFWLVGSSKPSMKQSQLKQASSEHTLTDKVIQNSQQTPKSNKQVDLFGVEEFSDKKEVQNLEQDSIEIVKQMNKVEEIITPSNKNKTVEEIFQDFAIPSERSQKGDIMKHNQIELNYASNQWNNSIQVQQVSEKNIIPQFEINTEIKENILIQKDVFDQFNEGFKEDKNSFFINNDSNLPNLEGPQHILSEIKEEPFNFNDLNIPNQEQGNYFDNNKNDQNNGFNHSDFINIEEQKNYNPFDGQSDNNLTKKQENNQTNNNNNDLQQFNEIMNDNINNKINQQNYNPFSDSPENLNKGKENKDININNQIQVQINEFSNQEQKSPIIDLISEIEFKEKQQNRQKQRYFSEITKPDKQIQLSLPQNILFHYDTNDNEQLNEVKVNGQKTLSHYQSNQSVSNTFKTIETQNYRMTSIDQQHQLPDPLDFYSHRPPTGYSNLKRGLSRGQQVVDFVQEHNILKEEQKKQLKRDQFMIEFNTDPNVAIRKLEEDQNLTLSNIAEFLLKAEGIRKNTLGQFFGKENQKNQDILREFCKIVDFSNQTIDEALRSLMAKFRLPGESQQINRIMSAFSESYHEQNPTMFENSDVVYILAYSIMMLHTDAHSQKLEKKDKMKRQVFIERTQSVIKSKTLTQKILGDIFDRIQAKQFECEQDAFEKAYDLLLSSHYDIEGNYAKQIALDVKYFKTGSTFIKYGRQGNPKEKFVYLSPTEDKICWCDPKTLSQKREILIEDIYEITIGYNKTEVMRKNKVPKQLDNMCFSLLIIGHDNGKRSLDLKAKDEEQRNKWVRFCYQKLLNAKQQAFEFKKAKFNMLEYKEQIAGIWKNQIFEQFDLYWDYNNNKPLHMEKYLKYKNQKKENNSQNLWKNVIKKKKQQNQKLNQVGIIDESAVIKEHIEDLQKNKELLFIRSWKQGLPHFVRKTLYKLSIGNKLEISDQCFQQIKLQADEHLQSLQNTIHASHNTTNLVQSVHAESPTRDSRSRKISVYFKIQQMITDLDEFISNNPMFKPNQEKIKHVLTYSLFYRQDLNYMKSLISIAALIVNIFQCECESFIYFLNLIYSYHFKPLYAGDKNKNFQKEMKELHERFIGINLGPQNYLYGWLFSLFSDYFADINIVYRILDNFLLEGEIYIFKAALGIIKMYEIDLRFSSFTIALKYLTEVSKNINEEFLFDTIECIDINEDYYQKFQNDIKKSQIKSLIHEILIEL